MHNQDVTSGGGYSRSHVAGKGVGIPGPAERCVGILGPMSGEGVSQVPCPGGGVAYPNLTELPVTGLPNLQAH